MDRSTFDGGHADHVVSAPLAIVQVGADRFRWLLWLVMSGGLAAVALAALGLPSADLHTPLHWVGVMDPLCGMTRGVRQLARGDVGVAWSFNPGVFLLGALAAGVLVRAVVGLRTNTWLELRVVEPRVVRVVVGVGIAALWINQQLHVARLR